MISTTSFSSPPLPVSSPALLVSPFTSFLILSLTPPFLPLSLPLPSYPFLLTSPRLPLCGRYTYHMLDLRLLDYFDYASKLDTDVSFVAPFPVPNLPLKLAKKGIKMMGTQNTWYYDDWRVVQGIKLCVNSFIDKESILCQKKLEESNKNAGTNSANIQKNVKLWLRPNGINATAFWVGNLNVTFRAHFLVFWLGLYASPEVKEMGKFFNDFHPKGMWDYR